MTKEEAINILKEIIDEGWLISDYDKCPAIDACEMAIIALKQEPILDQITKIIEPLRHVPIDEMSDIEWDILRVIDKYKGENEK